MDAAHHPFTRPIDGHESSLIETDPGARTRGRPTTWSATGWSSPAARSGSTSRSSSSRSFEDLGIGPEEQREKFGFLLDALSMGAPPHGGIASGIDRLLMALLGEERIRDTQAFPKNQVGYDYMTGAPIELTQEQLNELGIRVTTPPA